MATMCRVYESSLSRHRPTPTDNVPVVTLLLLDKKDEILFPNGMIVVNGGLKTLGRVKYAGDLHAKGGSGRNDGEWLLSGRFVSTLSKSSHI